MTSILLRRLGRGGGLVVAAGLLALALGALVAFTGGAGALSCPPPAYEGETKWDAASVVFVGVAQDGPTDRNGALLSPATFQVERYEKGSGPRFARVATWAQEDDPPDHPGPIAGSSYPRPGDRYRLFGQFDDDGVFRVGCAGAERIGHDDPLPVRRWRLAGADRIETAVAISRYAHRPRVAAVYLARADDFPDALAATSLADGPVLLVPRCGQLPALVAGEIRRLRPAGVAALGGTAAVCDAMLDQAVEAAQSP